MKAALKIHSFHCLIADKARTQLSLVKAALMCLPSRQQMDGTHHKVSENLLLVGS